MRTASNLFNANPNDFVSTSRQIDRKLSCFLARHNFISPSAINSILPPSYAHGTAVWTERRKRIVRNACESKLHSLHFLHDSLIKISDAFNAIAGGNFFDGLVSEQRKSIYCAVFDQYPIWLMKQFRKKEARHVSFELIWQSVDSPDRLAYRSFYRGMFEHMMEETFRFRVEPNLLSIDEQKKEVQAAWAEFPMRAEVVALDLGGVEMVPM
jgi:hypothetical protein